MIPSRIALTFLVFLLPPALVLVFSILRVQRGQAQAERDALPFAPEPEPAPGLLQRFTPQERTYLRAQIKVVPYVFVYLTWICTFLFALPVFNPFGHVGLWTDPSTLYWYEFLDNLGRGTQMQAMMVLLAAAAIVTPLRWGGYALFHRTRPISFSFLFWARVLPAVVAVALSLVTAVLLALGLFYLLHGPVWQHLPAVIPRTLGPDDADVAQTYAALLVTSVPRLVLSYLTTTGLYAGVALLIASLPIGGSGPLVAPRLIFLMMPVALAPPILRLVADFKGWHAPRWLFFYSEFGPPPPYGYALVPILLTMLCILLARRLLARVEL